LLCAYASGCGSSGSTKTDSKHHARSGTVAARAAHKPAIVADYTGGYLKSDDEDDKGKHIPPAKSDDTLFLESYGKRISPTEERVTATLVKRYYTAAAVSDGARTCALLDAGLVAGLTEGQNQTTQSSNTNCATIASTLLKQQHKRLAADKVASLVVIQVRAQGNLGLAVVGFKTTPVSEILLKRQQNKWKIGAEVVPFAVEVRGGDRV